MLRAAFENEFSLATHESTATYVPVDSGAVLLDDRDDRVAGLRRRARRRRSTRSGIPLEQYYAELGHGQQEISTAHAPAVQAADEQLLVRETIRGVAPRHGLVASLAPKPWPENAGNGGHVHFSLWEGDAQPLPRRDAPDGLSAEARVVPRGRARAPARACAG